MIKYLYANNYKNFVNFRVDFDSCNLLLGANGVGKSNLLWLIFSLCSVVQTNRGEIAAYFPQSSCTRWMNSNIQTFEIGLSDGTADFTYHLEIEHDTENGKSRILVERLLKNQTIILNAEKGEANILNEITNLMEKVIANPLFSVISIGYNEKNYKSIKEFYNCVNKIIYCVPDPKQMTSIVHNDEFIPKTDMSNTASVYIDLIESVPEFQSDFSAAMKGIDQAYIGANSSRDTFPKSLSVHYQFNDVRSSFSFNELSDGEKVLFALYMALYGFLKRGCTLLMDEPDNYLGIREIQPFCMELEHILLEGGQSIMVSHHPDVVDYFTDSSGIWMKRLKSGECTIIDNPFEVPTEGEIRNYSELIADGSL